jgi:hypothetical protein
VGSRQLTALVTPRPKRHVSRDRSINSNGRRDTMSLKSQLLNHMSFNLTAECYLQRVTTLQPRLCLMYEKRS